MGSLITNTAMKNASDVPGAAERPEDDVVYREFERFTLKLAENFYSGVFGDSDYEYGDEKCLRFGDWREG